VIKFYQPRDDSALKGQSLAFSIMLYSDYDCLDCGKTHPLTERTCIQCGSINEPIKELIRKIQKISNIIDSIKNINNKNFKELDYQLRVLIKLKNPHAKYINYIINNPDNILNQLIHYQLKNL
jgi:DNA-directed RNA polymerase subunit RPC12/RpoP